MPLKRVLTVRDVVLFNVVAMLGIRSMATAAKMGAVAIPLWGAAVIAFMIPFSFAVAELATADPGEGGVYRWTRDAFGPRQGFFVGWCYWVSNIPYIATLLTAVVGYFVYAIDRPDLGEARWFVTLLSLGVLAFATWLNVRGLELGRWVSNAGAVFTIIAVALVVLVCLVAARHHGWSTPITGPAMAAELHDWTAIGYFGTLAFGLSGAELAAGMGGEVRDPSRTFPRAILISAVVTAAAYIAGTLGVLASQTPDQVSPISGALGSLRHSAAMMGLEWVGLAASAMIAVATVAGVFAWLGGVARLPFAAGIDRYVPPVFSKLHPRYGTPYVAIIVQAVAVAICVLASEIGAGVRAAFLMMLSMTIIMNFIPYLYCFLDVARLRRIRATPAGTALVPGGAPGMAVVVALGTACTLVTIATSALPTEDAGNPWLFELKVWGGLAVFFAIGTWMYWRGSARAATSP
jgi:amino acid transporter